MRSESQTEYEPTLQNARVLFQMRPKKIQTSQKSGKTPLTLCGPEEFPPWPSDEGAEAGPLLSRLQGEVSQQSISEICKQWPCALPVWVRSLRGLLGNRRADLRDIGCLSKACEILDAYRKPPEASQTFAFNIVCCSAHEEHP